ncbi:MAG: pilus assembly FimT family protein [Fusobacteriaceae bacterium]
MTKNKGFTILETIVSVVLMTILLSASYPFFKFYSYTNNFFNETSSEKEILILLENIGNLIFATTIEVKEQSNYPIKNKGIAILKLENKILSNQNLNVSQYILKDDEKGDSIYIEIPEICIGEKITIKNQFYIYRFFKNSLNGKNNNQIRFVKGRESFIEGNREEVLKLGKEEILNSNIESMSFKEVVGGIEVEIKTNKNKIYKEILLKNDVL